MSRLSPRKIVLSGLLALSCFSCNAAPPFDAQAVVQEWVAYMHRDYALKPGDTLSLSIMPAEVAAELRIPPSGKMLFPRLREPILVAGKSLPALRQELQRAYTDVFAGDSDLHLSLMEVGASSVYVAGEVREAGVIAYHSGMTLSQAVSSAGGLQITAKPSDVRILRNRPGQEARTFRIRLDSILYEGAADFVLLPGDVVFCQTSAVADVGNWIELYIRRLLPIPNIPIPVAGG